jgi:hypothetical protein
MKVAVLPTERSWTGGAMGGAERLLHSDVSLDDVQLNTFRVQLLCENCRI